MSALKNWTPAQMPDCTGVRSVVTGANSGLGFVTALELARRGGEVCLAVRDVHKGEEAVRRIRAEVPAAQLQVEALDLASLQSVREFATRQLWSGRPLQRLINNAGIMAVPTLQRSADGFELQMGTNHFGHFALTGLLWPLLRENAGARVVTVASHAHNIGRIRFDDVDYRSGGYHPWMAYGQSKLANLLFALELHRRCRAQGIAVQSLAVHPGAAATNLVRTGATTGGARMPWTARISEFFTPYVAQSAESGAIPTLYAASAAEAQSGAYYGPSGPLELTGAHPRLARLAPQARKPETAQRLWQLSEERTGVHFI